MYYDLLGHKGNRTERLMYCFCLPCEPRRASALPPLVMNCFEEHILHASSVFTTSARHTISSGSCSAHQGRRGRILRFSHICDHQTARTAEVSVQKGKYNALRSTYCHREKDTEGKS
jgi:hypothetical protein